MAVVGVPPRPRAAVGLLPAYRPGRQSGIRLASNESPFEPLPSVQRAIADAAAGAHRYPDPAASAVQARVADRFGVPEEWVGIGPGTVGLLQQLTLAFAGPGDEVVFGWPSFEAYPVHTRLAGATPVTVPLREHTIDLDAIAAHITERTRLVLLANPNNPTGTAFSAGAFDRLLEVAPSDCLIVLDEAYCEFATNVPDGPALVLDHPNLAVLRTFSKAYGLAGLRIGYVLAHPGVVDAVTRYRIPFVVNSIAQAAALVSLDHDDELAERVQAVVASRAELAAGIRALGLAIPEPQGNFIWLPSADATAELGATFDGAGISTRVFPEHGGIRVTVGTAEQNTLVLAALEAWRR